MDTNELIKALAADAQPRSPSLSVIWRGATVIAIVIAAAVFFAALGPRPDFAAAVETMRFLFKFVFTITLAGTAFMAAQALSRPGSAWHRAILYLAAGPLLLALAVLLELFAAPPATWSARLIGTNSMLCLTFIPLIGIGPLAIFLMVLRHGAPTAPALAGAVAGLLAGGIAAAFYAAHCPDDSPLFVATWYTIAITGLAVVGAIAANRLARW
ncbi:NrsF family protein (plasmid) [Phyllobacteriaceae bacterium JZ32]